MFSGRNSFSGEFWEVFNAKRMNVKPGFPDNFDPDLRDLIDKGWSREPRKRPEIKEFRSFFEANLMTTTRADGNNLHEEKLGNQFNIKSRWEVNLDSHGLRTHVTKRITCLTLFYLWIYM